MKPLFALTLDDESIGLLHRRPTGWNLVGSLRFDAPDLADALADLRNTALTLEPEGLSTKLILPASQVFYSMVYAPGPGVAVRRAQIAAGLEGQTPYEIDELVFDWSGEGEHVAVAVVARETLAEAEAFAVEHGFNPLCFTTFGAAQGFEHMPWFGPSESGVTAFGASAIQRDDAPMVILPPEPEPAPEPEPVPEPVPEPLDEDAQDRLPEADAIALAEQPLPEEPLQDAAPVGDAVHDDAAQYDPQDVPQPEAPEPAQHAAEDRESDPSHPEPVAAPLAEAQSYPAPDAEEDVVETGLRDATPAVAPPESAAYESPVSAPVVSAPAVTISQPAPAQSAAHPAPPPPVMAPAAPATASVLREPALAKPVAATLAASLATQRTAEAEISEEAEQTQSWPGEDDIDPLGPATAALAASLDPAPARPEPPRPEPLRGVQPARADLSSKRIEPLPAMPSNAPRVSAEAPAASPVTGTASVMDKSATAPARSGKGAKVKIRPSLKSESSAQPSSAGKATDATSEAEAMTLFGKRNEPRVGGKPRYLGLALTGALLVILLAIAIFAASFLEPDTEASALEPAPESQLALASDPTPAEPSAAPATDDASATQSAPPSAETQAAVPSVETAEAPQPRAEPAREAGLALAEGPVETLTLPLQDGAVANPPVARLAAAPQPDGDLAPAPPASLPAFGALFKFDAAGNIVPTPEGVVTPDGVTLMAARPARLPPPRPEGLVPAALVPPAGLPQTTAPPPAAATPLTEETTPTVGTTPAAAQAAAAVSAPEGGPTDAAAAASAAASDAAAATLADQPPQESAGFAPDQTHAGRKPRKRPGDFATPADEGAVQTEDDAAPSRAAVRPPTRPASIASLAARDTAERDLAEAAQVATAAAASLALLDPALMPGSRRPPARPASLSARASAAAAEAAATGQQNASLASTALQARLGNSPRPVPPSNTRTRELEDDGEPEVVRAAPAIPTRASVARQATVTRGLQLSGYNLIGVFGTSNARYALVRDNGGRMNRLQVGDRLDGGQVVAIGQSELSYRKRGGQTVKLQMPRS